MADNIFHLITTDGVAIKLFKQFRCSTKFRIKGSLELKI